MNDLLEKIKKYLIICEDVEFAYLFGSYAIGIQRKNSDIDIAVMFDNHLRGYDRFMRKLDVTNDLETILNKNVDVVDLEGADLPFIHQVLKNGKIIYERCIDKRVQFEVNFRKKYFDFKPVLDLYAKKVLERY